MWGASKTLNGAAKAGNCAAIRELVATSGGIDTTHMGGPDAFTPLLNAAYHGHVEAVVILASLGADLNASDRRGRSVEEVGQAGVQAGLHDGRKMSSTLSELRAAQGGAADRGAGKASVRGRS